ncbi:hypothetical protein ACAW74_24435 [Fibrella sp. WM1]|uniref:hypothetical protein n=1 Tax=Fibrella musci TaxID=3242485 RepID=UPI003522BDB3
MSKEAVQEQVKEIVLCNTAKNFNDEGTKSVALQAGKFTVSCTFNNNNNDLYRLDELTRAIEELL